MKKVLFLILCLFGFALKAYADFQPGVIIPSYFYGKGVIFIKGEVPVYEIDNDKTHPLATIKDFKITIRGVKNPPIEDTFVSYLKEKEVATLPVEADYDDWYYVCFSQKNRLFGWVKKSEDIDFVSYENLFNFYGRKNGVKIFRNLKEEYKKLYSAPDLESTVVDTFNFPKHVSLWLISGDWILVKITTYDGITKTGWFKWRLNDGTFLAFPEL